MLLIFDATIDSQTLRTQGKGMMLTAKKNLSAPSFQQNPAAETVFRPVDHHVKQNIFLFLSDSVHTNKSITSILQQHKHVSVYECHYT